MLGGFPGQNACRESSSLPASSSRIAHRPVEHERSTLSCISQEGTPPGCSRAPTGAVDGTCRDGGMASREKQGSHPPWCSCTPFPLHAQNRPDLAPAGFDRCRDESLTLAISLRRPLTSGRKKTSTGPSSTSSPRRARATTTPSRRRATRCARS